MTNITNVNLDMMSDIKFYTDYSRWNTEAGRFETWSEAVSRVMDMHKEKYADKMNVELFKYISLAEKAYSNKWVLGAQRALQFGGDQILNKNMRMFNCAYSPCNRTNFFQQAMWILLCGCGAGFSVQKHHVAQLPTIRKVNHDDKVIFSIPDTIEGWADAYGVLLSSYFTADATFPDYQGKYVVFDYDNIRPKGAMISGGFKAPGPDGLRRSIEQCRSLLERQFNSDVDEVEVRPIVAYDIVMHQSDAVLSGGVRRSATICLFSKDDYEMMTAKTSPDWWDKEPQRKRSNNSVVLKRDETTEKEFSEIIENSKMFGEPGFYFVDDLEHGTNPCCEIGLYPYDEFGNSGWQMCNLCDIAGGSIESEDHFYQVCEAAAILGTLQAGYTDFDYLGEVTERITRREALLGVGITGIMSNPDILLNPEILKTGAEIVKETNKKVASLLGINPAARCTTVKPSGNSSVLLKTSSGIHGVHSKQFIRNMNINKESELLKKVQEINPKMCSEAVGNNNGTDICVSFPISFENAIYNKDLKGVKLLEKVKLVKENWIEYGTNVDLCVDKTLRHNVSNTVTVDNWDEVRDYIFEHSKVFGGVSLLGEFGDKDYPQAPFTEILTPEEIVDKYGTASMFASGLIVDGLHAFNDDLWEACRYAISSNDLEPYTISKMKSEIKEIFDKYGIGNAVDINVSENGNSLLKRDWSRRLKKFAKNYFNNDLITATYCLKDIHNLHHWEAINGSIKPIDFKGVLTMPRYIEVDTMGAQACSGGQCEISF